MQKFSPASHVIKNSKYPSAKSIILSNLKLSVYFLSSSQNKYRQFQVQGCSNLGTGKFPIFGHMICPANFECTDYN